MHFMSAVFVCKMYVCLYDTELLSYNAGGGLKKIKINRLFNRVRLFD